MANEVVVTLCGGDVKSVQATDPSDVEVSVVQQQGLASGYTNAELEEAVKNGEFFKGDNDEFHRIHTFKKSSIEKLDSDFFSKIKKNVVTSKQDLLKPIEINSADELPESPPPPFPNLPQDIEKRAFEVA